MEELGTLKELQELGHRLLSDRAGPGGEPPGIFLAARLLEVRDREGARRRLVANAAQREFERRRGRVNVVLKARQMGMTTWIAGRFFLKTILQPGTLTVLVAHTREAGEAIFTLVGRMWDGLPEDWRRGPLRRSRANVGQMRFAATDSEFRVLSAADENAGRGLTIQNLHLSEVARWPGDAAATLAGLRASLVPGGEMTLESTPAGAQGAFYQAWCEAEGAGAAAVRHFFPWWLEASYTTAAAAEGLSEEERALVARHGLTAGQIGFRRGLEREFRGLRVQEFAEDAASCFRSSEASVFELEPIERRMAEVGEPLETRRGGALLVWLPALRGKEYLVAVDTAGGGAEGDFAVVEVIELATGMQCAELRERLGVAELARVAAELAREYGGAQIAVERNNHGSGVLAHLEASERYARVYGQGGVAGWLTSAGSKPGMVSRLGVLLAEQPELFFSRRLLGEARTFRSLPGGGTGAASGAHDDCVMAMAIAQAVRAERLAGR